METVQIDFQGMDASEATRELVMKHVMGLEERFGRITACRVGVTAPSAHHNTGGAFEISIYLAIPQGREVVIGTSGTDPRHADFKFALNDAFKRARRRLLDQARRLQRRVKTRVSPPTATVARLDETHGFLNAEDGQEIYFHRNSVLNGAFPKLAVGAKVAFAEDVGDQGPHASSVRPLGKHGRR